MTNQVKQLLDTSSRCAISFSNIDSFPLKFQEHLWSLLCYLRDKDIKWTNGELATSDSMVSTILYTIENYQLIAHRLGTVTPALTEIALQFETTERYNGKKWDEEEEDFYEDYETFYAFTWLREVPEDAVPFEDYATDFPKFYLPAEPEEKLDLSALTMKFKR
ncbi:hypothetical protein [Streptococcus loxodontisalivarius]|uniref:Uncharacterized protein n=1 Tax=Streptococcus loxodontisalivarius TaxID=1349415 RepID=A0ABS2PUF2_9STRE|nr:hypothetical protein [Streptococcus loxodontisalivarius]MBM7643315.1 hypothetical protein [Streptococcus loxodontisalivarius]